MANGGLIGSGGRISLIRVPFWLGCGKQGTELGPDSVVEAGLIAQLEVLGAKLASDEEVDCRESNEEAEADDSDGDAGKGDKSGVAAEEGKPNAPTAEAPFYSEDDGGGKVKHLSEVKEMSRRVGRRRIPSRGGRPLPARAGWRP